MIDDRAKSDWASTETGDIEALPGPNGLSAGPGA